ncbi:hypothetical protein [Bacteroides sp.]|uniref:hypothetical protein n=1 Tax=Bacteroides sp. TaxID=29523 RepID=UPI0026364ED2|nr:hypothetical protein [Bacteroides sp.]MDD3040323.1 hypothetical protein [Bacteroides sp.]
MKTNYLFPNYCKRIGWILFIPFCICGVLWLIDESWLPTISLPFINGNGHTVFFDGNDFMDELLVIGNTVALLLIAFAKERYEDECIAELRLRAFVYSILINYVIVILGTMFLYEELYFRFLCVNMFTILLLFIVIFNALLYKFRKLKDD